MLDIKLDVKIRPELTLALSNLFVLLRLFKFIKTLIATMKTAVAVDYIRTNRVRE